MLLNKGLLDNFNYPRPCFIIFYQKHVDKVFHSLTVIIRNGLLFILNNFEN
jgi:hypothetical protein